jgi:pimeloyl-ACP methyl ester carboxylesterase
MARLLLAVSASAFLVVSGAAPAGADPADDIAEVTVTFDVVNANRSRVPCASDGLGYRLDATIVGPRSLLARGEVPAATLYVHGLGLSSYTWRFDVVPGYDHAMEMARLGHVSVVYDRLGYGDNPKPDGLQTCYGSEADVVDQIARALKSGDYDVPGRSAPTFDEVVVLGHSQAGLIVQPFAYSFTSHDALAVVSWTDEGNRPVVTQEATDTAQTCLAGGEQPEEGQRPPYYAFYPDDEPTFQDFYFHASDPAVVEAAIRQRQPDPCGNGGSLAQTLSLDRIALGDIDVPVLLVYGMEDGYRPQPSSGQGHAERFTGSPSVTAEFIDDAGNALTLERAAPEFRSTVSAWLCDQGFAAASACRSDAKPVDHPQPTTSASPGATADGERGAGRGHGRVGLPATGAAPALAWVPLTGLALVLARRPGP